MKTGMKKADRVLLDVDSEKVKVQVLLSPQMSSYLSLTSVRSLASASNSAPKPMKMSPTTAIQIRPYPKVSCGFQRLSTCCVNAIRKEYVIPSILDSLFFCGDTSWSSSPSIATPGRNSLIQFKV